MLMIKKIYECVSTWINVPTMIIHKVNYTSNICIRGRLFVKNNTKKRGAISIGDRVTINSSIRANPVAGNVTKLYAMRNGKITIGNNVGLSNCTIISNHEVVLADDVLIGAGTLITDTDFHSTRFEERITDTLYEDEKCNILIDSGVFIGANCIVLKGVTIGKHSVIGAGSVVTKSVPEGEIWAGNPVRFIKKIV